MTEPKDEEAVQRPKKTSPGAIDDTKREMLMSLLNATQWNLLASCFESSNFTGAAWENTYKVGLFLRSLIQCDEFRAQLQAEQRAAQAR